MNAVEREPVLTRVLNPKASEASYKPKQRSYRKTNLKKKVLAPDSLGAQMSGAQTAAPKLPDPPHELPCSCFFLLGNKNKFMYIFFSCCIKATASRYI